MLYVQNTNLIHKVCQKFKNILRKILKIHYNVHYVYRHREKFSYKN